MQYSSCQQHTIKIQYSSCQYHTIIQHLKLSHMICHVPPASLDYSLCSTVLRLSLQFHWIWSTYICKSINYLSLNTIIPEAFRFLAIFMVSLWHSFILCSSKLILFDIGQWNDQDQIFAYHNYGLRMRETIKVFNM